MHTQKKNKNFFIELRVFDFFFDILGIAPHTDPNNFFFSQLWKNKEIRNVGNSIRAKKKK